MEDLNGGGDNDDANRRGQYFLLETTHRSPKFRQKNALAMFVTVVETGKLRLVQIIQFIARHLSPQNWSLVYSTWPKNRSIWCLTPAAKPNPD